MRQTLFVLAAAGAMAGCAPRVSTEVLASFPATEAAHVKVYTPQDSLPDGGRQMGWIAVTDGGLATRCRYDRVVRLAQERTAALGGDGLYIVEHVRPSFWGSSCDQIQAMMLRFGQLDSLTGRPVSTAAELARAERQRAAQHGGQAAAPANSIRLGGGLAWTTSRVETPLRTYRWRGGYELSAGYRHLWRGRYGLGVDYMRNYTTYGGTPVALNYVGASFVGCYRTSLNWLWSAALGLGYAHYSEHGGYRTGSGVGLLVRAGAEYMVSSHVGLGIDLSEMVQNYGSDETTPDRMTNGFKYLALTGGLRFYF